ncbi:hypothetical protein [Burkholderia sp. TSV86]|uniref:hypothetical protein n=1 Tax=Burkholderia sp. TSV86 TaxID=1385594 RepID=UPI000B25849D|nr:hypothetical protein [Burkholderia sp. TSV86]
MVRGAKRHACRAAQRRPRERRRARAGFGDMGGGGVDCMADFASICDAPNYWGICVVFLVDLKSNLVFKHRIFFIDMAFIAVIGSRFDLKIHREIPEFFEKIFI